MRLYRLVVAQRIPRALETVWTFFSRPENLKLLTPPYMEFAILSPVPEKMQAGLIIEYRVRPLWNLPMRWVTEITHLHGPEDGEPPYFFVDEQRFGPYRFWHHRHIFTPQSDGTLLMQDIVHYAVPGGKLGTLFHPLIVRPRLEEIFRFRQEKVRTLFGGEVVQPPHFT